MPMLDAKIVGSLTAVSLEPATTFPATEYDNLIQGFAWLKNGFTLEDATTTCTFNGLYPVSGDIALHGGTMYLTQDVICKNATNIASLGTIYGNMYGIDMCSSITTLPAGDCILENAYFFLHNDLTIYSTITIRGTCIFEGNENIIHIADSGSIIIAPGSRLIVRRTDIQGLSGSQISCADDSAVVELDNVIIEQDSDCTFDRGSLLFKNTVDINGSYTFSYDSGMTSTIAPYSSLRFFDGTLLKVGRKKAVDYVEPLAFVDGTSRLIFDNCSLVITATGVGFTNGEIVFSRNVACYMQSNDKNHGAVLGDGNPAHDVSFYYTPGCEVTLYTGAFTYKNGTSNKIKALAKNARLRRTSKSYVYVERDCVIPGITIELLSTSVPPIAIALGVDLSYQDASVIVPGFELDITAHQIGAFMYNLAGNQGISLTKGQFPAYIYIQNSGNVLEGTGSILGSIIFHDRNAELIWKNDGYIVNSVNLNGGTLILQNNLNFCANGAFSGPGIVNLGMTTLTLCEKEAQLVPSICFIGQTGKVEFTEKLSLSSTCTFQGNCIFDGNGGVLDLGENAAIVVADNSTLKFRDMTIWGVNSKKIRCLTDSGRIELDNVRFVQDDKYTFDTGSMSFLNTVAFSGGQVFSYESKMTSTIESYALLNFDQDMTCSLSRVHQDTAVGPIVLKDNTSALSFDNSTLYVHTNGFKLTKGTVYCNRNFMIDILSTSSANGLILGDGTPEGDITIQFMPGSAVVYPRGHVVYDVTQGNGLRSKSNTARIIRYDDSVFYLRHNCTISDLTVETTLYALFETENGAVLSYNKGHVAFERGAFEVTGDRYNTYANLLGGNDYLFITKGVLPFYTLVDGVNNTIYGNGDIVGGVTLLGSGASLTWSVNGLMMNDIMLSGGQLTLTTNLYFADTYFIKGPGIVHMNGKAVYAGESDLSGDAAIYWDSGTGKSCVELDEKLALSAAWTFSGVCRLKGNGTVIDLDGGEIIVEQGSKLIIENVTIKNVAGTNIRCLGDSSTIEFENVTLIQKNDFSFERGSFEIGASVTVKGFDCIFSYLSTSTSRILPNSCLLLDLGLTFSYAPTNGAATLLQFADGTAQLELKGATLHTASNGLQLTKGCLNIKYDAGFSSDSIVQDGELVNMGITLGDGVAEHDMYCELFSGVDVHILNGFFNYKNVSPNSWFMHDYSSKLFMDAGTTLRLYQNLTLGGGYISFGDGSTLAYVQGKSITGATGQEGAFYTTVISPE
jgi:hypothetical protein